jgi:riboflavin biosynthesis pyrimidine reductase
MNVVTLFPTGRSPQALQGLYLAHRLHELGSPEKPFVYGNFVCSLDGRIAVDDAPGPALQDLSSASDFRLFLELHAQADCLITHGGYLRALAAGRLGNVLQVNANGQTNDLTRWRAQHGLPAQPAIVVASASLNFEIPASVREHGQRLYVATVEGADPTRVRALRAQGVEVIVAGNTKIVEGATLVHELGQRGLRSLYLLAGPAMLETMLRDQQLSRLYLTLRHRLVGGERFHTMIAGPRLDRAGRLELRELYYDTGEGQMFAQFVPQAD